MGATRVYGGPTRLEASEDAVGGIHGEPSLGDARGLDRLRMTSFIAEPSIPSREQPRKEAEKEAKGNLLLNPVFLIPLSIMLLLVLDMVLVVVLFVGLGVFFLAKSR